MNPEHDPQPGGMAQLVASAVTATTRDRGALAALTARSWGGGSDRLVPAAVPWVRAWGPHRVVAEAPDCACAASRCTWCN